MERRIRKAVFPVGGLGTRFLPATKAMPKEMLPVVDKPLIQYAVEEAAAAGIEEFIFVTGRGKQAIEDHFDHSEELERALLARGRVRELEALKRWLPAPGAIAYTRQQEPLGLGHAVLCARHLVGEEPFTVLLADDLILSRTPTIGELVALHAKTGGNVVSVMEIAPARASRYGIVAPGEDDGRVVEVSALVEKPDPADAPSNLAVVGRYVLQPEIFAHLEGLRAGHGGEIQLTDALTKMIGERPLHGVRLEGQRFDCGDRIGFLKANLCFALMREDLREETRRILEESLAGASGTDAKPSAKRATA
ncbi:MAG: UTP--glucose-1-phosphate uridylyltransferase GalU [Alphaproteobacteria bacterium]